MRSGALLHPERVGRIFAVGALSEVHKLEEPVNVGRCAPPTDPLEVAQIPASRKVRIEGRRLDHRSNPPERRRVASGIAEDPSLAARRVDEP